MTTPRDTTPLVFARRHASPRNATLRNVLFLSVMITISGCAVHQDDPLPAVNQGDPTWQLQPDHLTFGQLPK